ncbi:MAG: bifunctional oligoribonuclease/PAP phosphatase NrnA [Balneolales bacterium]
MIKKFTDALVRHNKIGLISHIRPDGDAIGSQLALYYWLHEQGVESLLFNDDPVPANLIWLNDHHLIQVPTVELLDQCDAYLFIDGNHPDRFGKMAEYFKKTEKPVYLIDHHLDPPDGYFSAMISDTRASSTAFLVYTLFELSGLHGIHYDVAEALYCGIVTDTDSFRFDSVTADTHFAVAEIIKKGKIKPSQIYEKIFDDKSISEFHLLGEVLRTVTIFCNNQIAITHVTQKMLSETGCTNDDLEGFVNYPLSLKGVKVSGLFLEQDDQIKISLRGKSLIDLNKIAKKFQGGGHFNAAGARHPGPLQKAVDDLVNVMASYIHDGSER